MSILVQRLNKHFVAMAALGAAAAVTGTQAHAAIVSSGPISINIPSTTAGVYLNVVTGVSSVSPGSVPGWDINPWSSSTLNIYANNAASPGDGIIGGHAGGTSTSLTDNLPVGTLIDAASPNYGRTNLLETTGPTAFVLSSTSNLIGFRFTNEANGNAIHFGWARISIGATLGGQPRAIVEYAYEDQAGVGIEAGVVPAPTAGMGLLTLGGLGLLGRRRK